MSNYGSRSPRRTTNTTSSRRAGSTQAHKSNYSGPSSGRGTSGSGRSSRNSHHGKRRKRRDYDITQILMYGIGAVIVILCIALAVRGCGKLTGAKGESTEASESSTGESSGEEVTVDGIAITGMSQEEARAAILKQYDWNMKVTYQDKEASVANLMEEKVDELLDEMYAGELKPGEPYTVNTDNMIEAAKAEAALIAGNWNMVAKNGGISGYDKETGKFTFTEGTNGLVIDQDKLAQEMVAAIQKKDYSAAIPAEVKEVSPELTAAQLKDKYKTIATYTTKTTSNSNRNENIRLACNALNGTIVNPGQEFSFNDTTGARTEAKGYKPATAYLNGEIVQEPGGGVCQVSSTLYNAVIFAGLKSTERHAHSYEPSYVTPGEDAAVSFGGPDFKFVNNSDFPVAIKTSFANQELTTSIYGVQILKDGEKIRMSSEKKGTIDPPAPTYEEDQTLQLDEEKVTKEAVPGSSWSTYLVTYEDGKEVSREFFHNSSYRGKAAIIKRNTSGVVVTTVDPTAETMESLPGGESQSVDESGGSAEGPGGEVGPAGDNTVAQSTEAIPAPGGDPGGQSPGGAGVPSPGALTNPVIDSGPAGPGL